MLFRAAALISAFLALGPSFAAAEDNVLTPAEVRAGWKLLFDGKSADQFRNYKKDSISSGWKIENGALVRADKGAGGGVTLRGRRTPSRPATPSSSRRGRRLTPLSSPPSVTR